MTSEPTITVDVPTDLAQHCVTVFALIRAREKITIAEAAQRTGIPAEIITTILAIYYAVADEMLKLVDPASRSLH
jgi:hypothetical protein